MTCCYILQEFYIQARQLLIRCTITKKVILKHFSDLDRPTSLLKSLQDIFREYCPYVPSVDSINQHATISYVKQNIPSPDKMIPFEAIFKNETTCYQTLLKAVMLNKITSNATDPIVEFSGVRVKSYSHIIDLCDEVQYGVRSFLTGDNRTNEVFKYWKNMPEQYQTIEIDTIVHNMNSIKATTIAKCCIFQTKVTLGWSPQSDDATKLLLLPVSLRDEIKTTGFGMAVIELLCLVGIYDEEKVSDTITNWGLDRDGEQRRTFLCIDGLSLDRHRHF